MHFLYKGVNSLKKISFLITILIVLNLSFTSTTINAESNESANTVYVKDNYTHNDGEIEPYAVAPVLIFIGGIAAGYIVDGVLIRYTGHSGGEWVAKALTLSSKKPTCNKIVFLSRSSTAVCASYSKGKF